VFRSEGLRVIQTPVQAPNANAFAERFVRTVRQECLDRTLVFGERHLKKILREFMRHYNTERPHRGLFLETPEPQPAVKLTEGKVVRVAKLGGLINEYHRIAA
jgi:transposase InsO family protein